MDHWGDPIVSCTAGDESRFKHIYGEEIFDKPSFTCG